MFDLALHPQGKGGPKVPETEHWFDHPESILADATDNVTDIWWMQTDPVKKVIFTVKSAISSFDQCPFQSLSFTTSITDQRRMENGPCHVFSWPTFCCGFFQNAQFRGPMSQ